MANQNPDELDFAAKQELFWSYAPEPNDNVGRIATDYLTLWRDAKGGEHTDYIAGMILVSHMPTAWAPWAWVTLEEMAVRNDDEEPISDLPAFVHAILTRWTLDPDHPPPPPNPFAVLAEPVAREPPPPANTSIPRHEFIKPPIYPPPHLSPVHAPRSPTYTPSSPPVSPPAALWVRRPASAPPPFSDIPYATVWEPTSRFEVGSSSTQPQASVADSPPHPAAPPSSPTMYRLTARIRTMSPPGSPFRFTIPDYVSNEELESPHGPLDYDFGSGSLTYSSSGSRESWESGGGDSEWEKDLEWEL